MNILFLLGIYPSYGGVEKVTTVLANGLTRRRHQVSILSFEQPFPEIADRELLPSVRMHRLRKPVDSVENCKRLNNILRAEETDIIISQWCVPYYVAKLCRRAMRGTKCRFISVHHNTPDTNARIKDVEIALEQRRGNAIINRIKLAAIRAVSRLSLRYTYKASDCFVVLAPSFIPIAKKYIGIRQTNKIRAIGNPITLMPSDKDNNDVKQKEIVYVGRIEDNQKRTHRLPDIWKELEPAYPDWCMTVVGDGPDRKKLQEKIRRLNLQRMKVVGYQDPARYYRRASILVLVSEYEGFGLVIVEGMSFGVVPVVYGSYRSVYDIIDSGRDGVITPPPYSSADMVSALRTVMERPNLWQIMSANAIKKSASFALERILDEWEDLFKLLRQQQRRRLWI